VIALMAMLLPIAASASPIDIVNQFGSISITAAGISSIGSQLHSFGAFTAAPGHALGSVKFSTGVCLSGCNGSGIPGASATFSSVGSSFIVTSGGGVPGFPKNGTVLFSGTFVGPITWTMTSSGTANLTFTLTGTVKGTTFDGRNVIGTTTQQFFTIAGQLANGVGHIRLGNTVLVPEPGTLGLLGTGLLGIAGVFRRKFLS
jgi:hypothetical protein